MPEVKDLRRAISKKQNTVSVQQLQEEFKADPKSFKKKEVKPWQKQAMQCGYDSRACLKDAIDRTFHGR